MKRDKITITNWGDINIPNEVRMSISEIAELFGVFYQTAKKNIRDIEKAGIARGDLSSSCTVDRKSVYPIYYGLEMLIALAFQLQSPEADVFRKWVIKKTIRDSGLIVCKLPINNTLLN